MDAQQILIPLLATAAVGGTLLAFVGGESQADKRKAALQARRPSQAAAARVSDTAKRKKQVADSLKEIDARAKSKKITFETRMAQAGVAWSKKGFYGISAGLGVAGAAIAWILSGSPLVALGVAIVAGLGMPRWVVNHLRNKRLKKFLAELPGAVEIIVRGIKAGIPLGDCIRNIAAEAGEPVKSEFRMIVESQTMGLSIAEAVERIVDRVPTPEANFFAIVINIQSKAGGNLAEALSNLAAVLRDRKKMKAKIKAVSSEAKASAGIIGALPPLVGTIVYLTSPDYMKLLFITQTGHLVLAGCALWMGTGIFVMKKMINFDI